MAQKGVVSTQFPMGPIEDLGLLKMDFLGLSTLTIINNALRIIKKVYGETIDISNCHWTTNQPSSCWLVVIPREYFNLNQPA